MAIEESGITPRGRNEAIELLRVVAAYGIVAYHERVPLNIIPYAGLVVFLILSPFVDCSYKWNSPRSLSTLSKTFIVPWIFWAAVYGLIDILRHKPILPPSHPISALLYGVSLHLWFMPFMFFVLVLINIAKSRISSGVLYRVCAITGAASLVAISRVLMSVEHFGTPPIPQWVEATPAVLIGAAFGSAKGVGTIERRIGLSLIAAALIYVMINWVPSLSVSYPLGISATVLAIFGGRVFRFGRLDIRAISACMLGVYLCHVACLEVVARFAGTGTYTATSITFLLAFAVTWGMQRFVPVSQLVFGPAAAPMRQNRGKV